MQLGPHVNWERVRTLARQVDELATRGEATGEHAARLARLVLEFDAAITWPVRARPGTPPAETG